MSNDFLLIYMFGSTIILFIMIIGYQKYYSNELINLKLKYYQIEYAFDENVPYWIEYPYSVLNPEYSAKQEYFKGMIVNYKNKSFLCIRINGPQTQIVKPKIKE